MQRLIDGNSNHSSDKNQPFIQQQPPIGLFSAKQIYAVEQAWFNAGHASYGLMQQAAWHCAKWIYAYGYQHLRQRQLRPQLYSAAPASASTSTAAAPILNVCVWVGSGNNGADGWLIATYLSQLGALVRIVAVGEAKSNEAKLAKTAAQTEGVNIFVATNADFAAVSDALDPETSTSPAPIENAALMHYLHSTDIVVDAMLGIGLDSAPTGAYAKAIACLNRYVQFARQRHDTPVIAIDVPSGLVASTGQVFAQCGVQADITLCLLGRKLGLHIKDGRDYAGRVIDIGLIPLVASHCLSANAHIVAKPAPSLQQPPIAQLYYGANRLPSRHRNRHKGSFGAVLIIGGNQVAGAQGMGGAAILAASSAFAVGAGKVSVACHPAFHGSLIARLPNAMGIDLHDCEAVVALMQRCDVVAIGMGLGRDTDSYELFSHYIGAAMAAGVGLLIDADGLYHLPDLDEATSDKLVQYSHQHPVFYTPHSGEAARLLDSRPAAVEADRIAAIYQLQATYAGSWLLKGAGSIVLEQGGCWVCAAGNAGMATAGMGDVLSGISAGLMAQTALPQWGRSLQQAVVIHALAGDKLAAKMGQTALQATAMPVAVGEVMRHISV